MSTAKSTVRVKVSTEKLLAAVRKRRDQAVKEHERAAKEHGAKETKYRARVVDALRGAAQKIEDGGDFPEERRYDGDLLIPFRVKRPSEPDLDTSSIDRLIATLELATDESIPMTADDAARYLG